MNDQPTTFDSFNPAVVDFGGSLQVQVIQARKRAEGARRIVGQAVAVTEVKATQFWKVCQLKQTFIAQIARAQVQAGEPFQASQLRQTAIGDLSIFR